MRLIDADKLLSRLSTWDFNLQFISNAEELQRHIRLFGDMVRDEPTVDAVPVVHGKWMDRTRSYPDNGEIWLEQDVDYMCCSRCYSNFSLISNDTYLFDYCPNCGAKMDLEDGNDSKR